MEYLNKMKREGDIVSLYEDLKWMDHISGDGETVIKAMDESWHVIYVYEGDHLIGTGRVVSDGLINGYICGIGVSEAYRGLGIGGKILRKLVDETSSKGINLHLMCQDDLVSFYERKGFKAFTIGMQYKKD